MIVRVRLGDHFVFEGLEGEGESTSGPLPNGAVDKVITYARAQNQSYAGRSDLAGFARPMPHRPRF